MAIASFLDTEALGFIDGEIATVRYQADVDLNQAIVTGLLRR
jgi:hypothetical protein